MWKISTRTLKYDDNYNNLDLNISTLIKSDNNVSSNNNNHIADNSPKLILNFTALEYALAGTGFLAAAKGTTLVLKSLPVQQRLLGLGIITATTGSSYLFKQVVEYYKSMNKSINEENLGFETLLDPKYISKINNGQYIALGNKDLEVKLDRDNITFSKLNNYGKNAEERVSNLNISNNIPNNISNDIPNNDSNNLDQFMSGPTI